MNAQVLHDGVVFDYELLQHDCDYNVRGAANPGCRPAFQQVEPAESRLRARLPAPRVIVNSYEGQDTRTFSASTRLNGTRLTRTRRRERGGADGFAGQPPASGWR